MKRFQRALGLAVVLLVAAPALAADPELTEKQKLDRIVQDLQSVKKDLEDLRAVALQLQATTKDVRDLQRRLETLEQSLDRVSAGRTRISSSFTPSEATTGTIRLQNRFAAPATVRINGQPYPVPAYETRRVAGVPTGTFSYEVDVENFGVVQPAVTRTLNPNETFSIFINPPAPQLLLVQ
jgi:hypothetical protein